MQGIFQKENTDKALKYGIYRHLPTYEKIIRNLVSFYIQKRHSGTASVGSKKSFHLAGISGVWLFSGTGGTESHLDCTAVLYRSRVCRRWDGQHTGIEYQQDHALYSSIEDL